LAVTGLAILCMDEMLLLLAERCLLLCSSRLYVLSLLLSWVLSSPLTGLDPTCEQAPETPGGFDTGFPRAGTSVLLALDPEVSKSSVEVLVAGGQKDGFDCPHIAAVVAATLGNRFMHRLNISWEPAVGEAAGGAVTYTYKFGASNSTGEAEDSVWVEENMVCTP
jgi:hypothetical protein